MSAEEHEQHAGQQREEQNTLLRSLIGIVKGLGITVGTLLLTGTGVLIADHFKLIAVSEAVVSLTKSTEKLAEDSRVRTESQVAWRSAVDVSLLDQKARTLAIEQRVATLESEVRQQQRGKP